MSVLDRVADLVAPLVDSMGLSIYDIEQAGPTLRISVNGPDGVGSAALTRLTRMISSALDETDPVPGSYTLEVTSPGLERKLRTTEHFTGAIGELVKLKTNPGTEVRRIDGTLVAADAESVTVRTGEGTEHVVAVDDISSARTAFEWGPPPKPGGPKRAKRTKKSANSTKNGNSSRSAERSAR